MTVTLVQPQQQLPPAASRRVLAALGVAGGLLPSPSAVVVLLAAVAAGRAWFGVLLVLAFGAGMALTLGAVGYAVLHGHERLLAFAERSDRPRVQAVVKLLPQLTASVVLLVGLVALVRATT